VPFKRTAIALFQYLTRITVQSHAHLHGRRTLFVHNCLPITQSASAWSFFLDIDAAFITL